MPTYQGQFVSGQTLNAADLNWFTPAAVYTSTGNLSVANTTITKLSWATYGTAGISSWVGAGNGIITPTISGWYLVTCSYATGATTGRTFGQISKNASTVVSALDIAVTGSAVSLTGVVFMNGTTDNLACYTYQSSGGAVNYSNFIFSVSLMFQP